MTKVLLSSLFAFALTFTARSQKPYTWTFSANKTAEKTYELHCIVEIRDPWHTYSQFTPDGGPIPTKFTFSQNPLLSMNGAVKENGKLIKKHEAVFGVDVQYFDGKVDFVQIIHLKGSAKTNLSGSVEFMVCNDQQCLPPATEKFSVALN